MLSTTADVLKLFSRWEYIIKSAYYQIKIDKNSQQWLRTNSPYKGMYVYSRGPMGLRNMAAFLEEVVSRVAEGIVEKVADGVVVWGNNVLKLLVNWT